MSAPRAGVQTWSHAPRISQRDSCGRSWFAVLSILTSVKVMPVRYLRSNCLIAGVVALVLLPFVLGAHVTLMNQLGLATAYVTMALGLNVVVGFAGLLDLGYVAFYAIGAHVAAHLGSAFWNNAGGGRGVAILVDEPAASLPGLHFNFVLVLVAVVI